MDSKIHTQLIILFLVLLSETVILKSHSWSSLERSDSDFNNWVSWNVRNYQKKTALEAEMTMAKLGNRPSGKLKKIDVRLRKAELNKMSISVRQDGSGDFANITDALISILPRNNRRVTLMIGPGTNASDPPTITGNDTASGSGKDGRPLRTFQSATVAIEADYFIAVNVKFENTAPHTVGRRGEQAAAIRISGTKAAFYNCSFYGAQDTLYDHKGLHYFNNCFIQGSVDFIFGYGMSLYENCYLNSMAKKVASLTAQKRTNSTMASGFSFKDCVVRGRGQVYLGRAWGDYSRVVFSYSFMDNIVLPQGWSDWGDQNRHLKVYYGEYKCGGPGANLSGRVPWARALRDEEAKPFIGTYYIDGDSWLITPSKLINH
ncbi:hypothetical protein FEM48_Zijuj09G0009400 [Ziziphus jujuba var. spinosa]|uniref:Pectinesterase n=1 Tax=Ziziphus jujuba var. spinosa TaxID=714518 RepID=A0A978UPZ4_ZIZJJ|nr:hypothetical protein FEM48_Zijuj09G0009400 [Ziziphus jujuba var. spinosa]